MAKMIFINLPVADVTRSIAFYEAIGLTRDPAFSGEQAASLRWTDSIVVGVMSKGFYQTLTPKRIVDARADSQALIALGLDSRAEVDAIIEAAIAAGGCEAHEPEDHGFMYSRAFEDPDGHGFGPFFMDVAAFEAARQAQAEPA